jgi:transposase
VETPVAAHTRAKPTGRKPLPEKLPRVEVELLPPEVQQKGTDAFVRIGEDVTETVERRPASLVVVRVRKPKFVPKGRDATAETTVLQAPPPELPIDRALAGPGLLADTIVRRWQDHLPLHRLERIYGREGLELARSTICGWHEALGGLVKPLLDAMWADARGAPYLCTDATGVLVQAREKCRRGHFWVVIAPERHVLFRYSAKHDSAAVDRLLEGYEGYLVADAHAVFDHLYKRGTLIEVACWAHARRYWWKALETDPERARQALAYIGGLFRVERAAGAALPEVRLAARRAESKAIVDAFFTWCEAEAEKVLDETPTAKAIGYALNQRVALQRFLDDGRLPIHNTAPSVAARSRRKKELVVRWQRRRRRDQCRLRLPAGELPTPRHRALRLSPRPLLLPPRLAGPPGLGARTPQLEEDPRGQGRSAAARRQRLQARIPRLARPTSPDPVAPAILGVSDGVRRTDTLPRPPAL